MDWQDGFNMPCILFTWHIGIELVTKVLDLSLSLFFRVPGIYF